MTTDLDMRRELDKLRREQRQWVADVRRWVSENQAAFRDLTKLERLLVRHALACEAHAQEARKHGELLASVPRDGLEVVAGEHAGRKRRHEELRDRHESVRQHLAQLLQVLASEFERSS